jgi:hypothetical protein
MPAKVRYPEKILKKHVIQAAIIWDGGGYKNFKNSISYDVTIRGKPYPPKAISSCAHEIATGRSLATSEFVGSSNGAFHKRLKELGFSIVEKRPNFDFENEIDRAWRMSSKMRQKEMEKTLSDLPKRVISRVYRYVRNPLVVAERLYLANGKCEECNNPAPFFRKRNGMPYLEVHHIRPLSKGGRDVVSNTKAVCPNCHCKIHDEMDLDLFCD